MSLNFLVEGSTINDLALSPELIALSQLSQKHDASQSPTTRGLEMATNGACLSGTTLFINEILKNFPDIKNLVLVESDATVETISDFIQRLLGIGNLRLREDWNFHVGCIFVTKTKKFGFASPANFHPIKNPYPNKSILEDSLEDLMQKIQEKEGGSWANSQIILEILNNRQRPTYSEAIKLPQNLFLVSNKKRKPLRLNQQKALDLLQAFGDIPEGYSSDFAVKVQEVINTPLSFNL